MGYTTIAIVAGLVAGLVAGGRPRYAARRTLRWWPALAVGASAQWVPELLDVPEDAAFLAVVVSYVALGAFAVANLGLVGMPVVLVGLAFNVAVIMPNGGMPVRGSAVVAAGIADDQAGAAAIDYGSKRHLEDEGDRLTVLGDIIPVPPLREVLSFGDLILAAGIGNVVFRLLRPRHVPRPAPEADDAVVSVAEGPAPALPRTEPSVIDLAGEERRILSSPGA